MWRREVCTRMWRIHVDTGVFLGFLLPPRQSLSLNLEWGWYDQAIASFLFLSLADGNYRYTYGHTQPFTWLLSIQHMTSGLQTLLPLNNLLSQTGHFAVPGSKASRTGKQETSKDVTKFSEYFPVLSIAGCKELPMADFLSGHKDCPTLVTEPRSRWIYAINKDWALGHGTNQCVCFLCTRLSWANKSQFSSRTSEIFLRMPSLPAR